MSRDKSSNSSRRKGFTLLEVLVAMVILTISFTVLLQSISGGIRGIDRNRVASIAHMHAQSKFDEIAAWTELAPGSWQGRYDDGFSYEIEIFALGTGGTLIEIDLLKITVRILDPSGGLQIERITQRLGRRAS